MGGYTGASKTKRTMINWGAPSGDFDTDVLEDLPALRDRSEDLFRNNMMASSAINTQVNSVVGRGITAQPRIDAKALGMTRKAADELEAKIQRYWNLWSESKHCTINKKLNFREYQSVAFLSTAVRGDCFTLTPEVKPLQFFPFKLRLQLIEADRVCNKDNAPDTQNLSGGIATNSDGSLKEIHVLKTHPGSQYAANAEWQTRKFFSDSGRRNVLHLYRAIRGDQSRGVPDLAPVIEGLAQFSKLTQASIDAAVIQTFLSVFIETPGGEGLDLEQGERGPGPGTQNVQKLESAAIIDLADGEVPHFLNPTHPNSNFAEFAEQFEIQLGAAIGVPKEVLTKHFQSSYSAAQASLLEAWRFFMTRRSWLVDNLCQPVYKLFITELVQRKIIPAPGFFQDPIVLAAYLGADWVGPPRGHIRDDVQNSADAVAEDRGWKTAAQNTQERGGVWERNHRQRVKEVEARKKDGLITTTEEKNEEDLPEVSES